MALSISGVERAAGCAGSDKGPHVEESVICSPPKRKADGISKPALFYGSDLVGVNRPGQGLFGTFMVNQSSRWRWQLFPRELLQSIRQSLRAMCRRRLKPFFDRLLRL